MTVDPRPLRPPIERRARPLSDDPEVEAGLLRGQASFEAGSLSDAHGSFQEAHRRRPADPRCASWYGLTLILVDHNNSLGLRYCEDAVKVSGGDLPATWLNLARAFRALGYRDRAVKAVDRGLSLEQAHLGLRQESDLLGQRQLPVIRFLSRRHPLNRLLGRWRHGLSSAKR